MDNATKGKHGDFRGTTADIDDHGAGRFFDREADADGGSDWLRNGNDVVGTGAVGGVHDGTTFNSSDAVRDSHDDSEIGKEGFTGDLADKVTQHVLADLEVSDDAVLHRTQGLDVARGTTEHHASFITDGDRLARARANGDDAGLAEDDAAILEEDKRVGRAKVDANGLGE